MDFSRLARPDSPLLIISAAIETARLSQKEEFINFLSFNRYGILSTNLEKTQKAFPAAVFGGAGRRSRIERSLVPHHQSPVSRCRKNQPARKSDWRFSDHNRVGQIACS
ncbi:MAG: hypothetical protein QME69_07100, partial [Candidatus Saccharicenans sp.]|nr:hypothetical protein [Candidatus Saccharicenans sp.]